MTPGDTSCGGSSFTRSTAICDDGSWRLQAEEQSACANLEAIFLTHVQILNLADSFQLYRPRNGLDEELECQLTRQASPPVCQQRVEAAAAAARRSQPQGGGEGWARRWQLTLFFSTLKSVICFNTNLADAISPAPAVPNANESKPVSWRHTNQQNMECREIWNQ